MAQNLNTPPKPPVIVDSMLVVELWNGDLDRIPLSEIAIVAEVTTAHGPFGEDYYLTIVDKQRAERDIGGVSYASSTIEVLSRAFDVPLAQGLLGEANFNSRILYPKDIEGEPLYIRSNPPRTSTERILEYFGLRSHQTLYSAAAESVLNSSKQSEPSKK